MNEKYVWTLVYINNKFYENINKELKLKGYKGIRASIPTVSILEKTIKGENIYKKEPLLFNYGFIKMKLTQSCDRVFLKRLANDISGIHMFVKSTQNLHNKKLKRRIDNAEDHDDYSMVALVSREEVKRFRRISRKNQIYSFDNITSLSIGSYVILRGYPFEGIPAVVRDIMLKDKKVKLDIYPEGPIVLGGNFTIMVPMQNVLYSVYQNYDENKLLCESNEFNFNNIINTDHGSTPGESLDNVN